MRHLLLTTLIGLTAPVRAQPETDSEWFTYMADLNRGSDLESPGSKGALSLNVGAGIQTQATPSTNSRFLDQMRPIDSSANSATPLHFVSLHKGTPWPLDFGLNFGQTGDGDVKRVGGHAQWTWIDVPRGISVSTRAGFYRTDGFRSAQIESREAMAGVGGGYSYVRLYALAGMAEHQARLDSTRQTWRQPVGAIGMQTRLGTPFLTATLEWAYRDKSYRGLAAKLAIGI